MTLVANEIEYDPTNRDAALWCCAADRRITTWPTIFSPRRKIYTVDKLAATISFFGFMYINDKLTFDSYFRTLKCKKRWTTVEEFARWLTSELNTIVDKKRLAAGHSGFHIAGFSPKGVPQFWFITNIGGVTELSYDSLRDFYEVSERLRVDCELLYDASTEDFTSSLSFVLANGDLSGFKACWGATSQMENMALGTGLVSQHQMRDRAARMYCKMEVISTFYNRLATQKVVGKPIDVFEISSSKVTRRKFK